MALDSSMGQMMPPQQPSLDEGKSGEMDLPGFRQPQQPAGLLQGGVEGHKLMPEQQQQQQQQHAYVPHHHSHPQQEQQQQQQPPEPTAERTSLRQTLFSEFKRNMEERKWVDVSLAAFSDDTLKNEFAVSAHRLVLGGKSRWLRHLLRGLDCVDDVRLVLAGVGGDDAYDLMRTLYDPFSIGADIRLWKDDDMELPGFELLHSCQAEAMVVKPEPPGSPARSGLAATTHLGRGHEFDNADVEMYDYEPNVDFEEQRGDEEDEDYEYEGGRQRQKRSAKSATAFAEEQARESENLEQVARKYDLSIARVQSLVKQKSSTIEFKERGLNSSAWKKFRLVFYNGERIPFVCCRHCNKVNSYLPIKGSSTLCKHAKLCKTDEEYAQEKTNPDNKPLTAYYVSHLIRVKSDKLDCYPPDENEYQAEVWRRYKMVRYKGEDTNFVVCQGCRMVLIYNQKAGVGNLRNHTCRREKLIKNNSSVTKEQLYELWKNKSDKISLRAFTSMKGPSDKIRQVHYNDDITEFTFCKTCKTIFPESVADDHECATILKDIDRIYKNEPERIHVQTENTLNTMWPYIFPITLDGNDTEFVKCTQCDKLLPKENVQKEGFYHRCHRIIAHQNTPAEKFHSDNLIPLPKAVPNTPRTFQCRICNEILLSNDKAEVHMRTVHGEGGREVLCTYCGKGFATFRLARQHELMVHDMNKRQHKQYTCTDCNASFTDKSKLKRHILGAHSDKTPYVCDLCGKGFRWDTSLKGHMRTHGEKTFKCEFCEKSFHQQGTYMNHRMTHTGERPHACPICEQKFISITACKTHVQKSHGLTIPKGRDPKSYLEQNKAAFAPQYS